MLVLATALDPRTKMLYGVADDEKADVWKFVQKETVKVALQNRQEKNSEVASSQQSSAAASPPRPLVKVAPRKSAPVVVASWRLRNRWEAHQPSR